MILAEQQHQSTDGSSGAIVASGRDDDNLSSVQVHRVQRNHEDDRNRSAALQLSTAARRDDDRLAAASSSSEDEETSSSGSSVAEDEDVPMDELGQRGWIDNATLAGSEVNGIALPPSDSIQIGKIHATNTPNLHIGQRVFIKSKGNLIIKSVSYTKPTGPGEDQKEALENGSIQSEKDKDGFTNFGSTVGPKLSTATDTSDNPLYPTPHGKVAEWFLSRRCTITICIAALVLLLITVLSVWLTSSSGTANATIPPYVPASPNDTSINNDPTIKGVRVVPRVEWGAQPPTNEPTKLQKLPPPYVIISHTATTFCYTQAQCVLNVRVAQTFHIESKGWEDIAYNFLVGGDGNIYEGRGWGIEGSHTFNYNIMSIGISFIGTFNSVEPTKAQLHAAMKLIEFGVENGHISKDYKLLGHRQCVKTESPGEVLYNIIKTWEHWSPTP